MKKITSNVVLVVNIKYLGKNNIFPFIVYIRIQYGNKGAFYIFSVGKHSRRLMGI